MVSFTDLKIYKTTNNLGGAITGTQVAIGTSNNVFTNIPKNELVVGEDYYACIYLKNTHATETMASLKLWLSSKSFPHDTVLKWAFDPAGNTAQTISDKYTTPGVSQWHDIETETTAPFYGDLAAGASFPIWLWLHVDANAEARLDDNAIFTTNLSIPQGGTGGGGTGGTGGGTGGNPPPTNTDYKIAIAGDWGCETATDQVISLIQSQGYDFVMGVGDNAYESAGCWTTKFNPLKSKMNSAYGNHEYSESGGVSPYKTFFGHSLTYFSFQFQNVFFIVCDTNINCDPGSAQHQFVTTELNRVLNDSTVTWRIGIMHHPWFGSPSDHAYDEANAVEAFHKLFTDNKVNIVCTGHNHNWQRTHQVSYNSSNPTSPTVVDSTSPYSRAAAGLIHVITGTGGHDSGGSLYGLGSQPSFQAYQNRTHNGVWEILASDNAQTFTCQFREIGGDVFDTFTIS